MPCASKHLLLLIKLQVKAPRLVISHAIPSQSHLTAPPCSAYIRTTATKSSTRYTYAALRDELRGRRQQIVGFVHTSSKSTSITSESVQHTWESAKNAPAISHLEVVPAGDDIHELIAVHQDGHLRGLSADLQKEHWTASVEGDVTVEHTFIQSAGEANRCLLKDRADLLLFLETSGKDQEDIRDQTTIIGIITRNNTDQKRTLNVFAVRPPSIESAAQLSSRTQSLIQWPLPAPVKDTEETPQYRFDIASGLLLVVQGTTLTTYTFSTLGPRLLNQVPSLPESTTISSFIPLQQSLSLVMTSETCSLLNTHYNSVLASTAASIEVTPSPSKKRKLTTIKTTDYSKLELIDYFRSLNIAVAIKDSSLLALQLRLPTPVRGRSISKPAMAPRLIDSLGRGIPSTSAATTRKAPPTLNAPKIDELARSDPSLVTLANIFIEHPKTQTSRESRSYVNLDGLVRSLKWILQSFSTSPAIEQQQQAQLTNGDTSTTSTTNGTNGIATQASATNSDSGEASFLAEVSAATADLSLAVALISSASTTPSDSTSTDPITLRAMTLEHLLTRLGTSHPPALLARTFRSQLSQHDLFLLMELLRHALEQGGWASKVLDVYPEEIDPESDPEGQAQDRVDSGGLDSSVRVIGTLISCAVDALGAGAWLTGGVDVNIDAHAADSDDEMIDLDSANAGGGTRPLLPTLRHLTTTVLEVTQEAAFFRSFLADFLRYADTLAAAPVGVQNRLANEGQGGGMLPFGVRAARGVEATVVKAGGEVKVRTKRELASRISREVGIYNFERVRV